ncbi:MAG: CDP-glucose 4,6-dehydratase [Acidobacteriota bacterium]|nr:CDP-glucose 4,6-dehydratase [Acidobacteriota bacterium]
MGGLENVSAAEFWRGKRVFVTGHTGFKGGWLAVWLSELGADVTGYGLDPDTEPSFYRRCGLRDHIRPITGDVRDELQLRSAIETAQPEIIFHLAAQALVRRSYREPVETFATNVMGTVHALEAARRCGAIRAVVIVTSDKCYENREWLWAYRENEPLGGRDPYSASKGCAELVTAAFRASYFERAERPVGIATARAGNVIGGGDWSEDRLVPDSMRALCRGERIEVRNPHAIRPWQHVLEPLAGYLLLARKLYEDAGAWSGAWNFGPPEQEAVTVASLSDLIVSFWQGASSNGAGWQDISGGEAPHEAQFLKLDSSKARQQLGWRPRLTLPEAVRMTVEWYRRSSEAMTPSEVLDITREQIASYQRASV